VSPLLQELHWLHVPKQIDFCLAVLVYCCINGPAPRYLASELQWVADIESRGHLRSSSTALLHIPRSLRKTHQQPCLPHCRCKCLEHATSGDHIVAITADLQACIEDGTGLRIVQCILPATAALTLA